VTDPASPAPPPRRIVVAYDGSEPSDRAVRFALEWFDRSRSEIWIVHAAAIPRIVAEPRTDEEQGSEVSAIEQGLRLVQARVDPSGERLHVRVREGAASAVILATADEVKADLIVVGTRGLRGASRLLLGSVSSDVVVRSKRPVTVVP
jgi:nucleotide-binding universal stress UspA family protein